LDHGANKYIADEHEEIPFNIAKKLSNSAITDILVDTKATGLITSIRNQKLNSLTIFVKSGQNLSSQDKFGMTPLLHSLTIKSIEYFESLIKAPAAVLDISLSDIFGNNLLHYISHRKDLDSSVSLFKKYLFSKPMDEGKKTTTFGTPPSVGQNASGLVNNRNKEGETPLHLAALYGNLVWMKCLIENNADVTTENNIGESVLHYAVIGGRLDCVSLVLDCVSLVTGSKLDGEKKSKFGESPQSIALKSHLEDILSEINQANLLLQTSGGEIKSKIQTVKQIRDDKEKIVTEKKMEKEKEKLEKEKLEKLEREKVINDKEKLKKDKEKEKERQKEERHNRKSLLVTANEISGPTQVRHDVHVSRDFTWTGGDASEIFTLEKKVGEGAYGSVYKALQKSHRICHCNQNCTCRRHPRRDGKRNWSLKTMQKLKHRIILWRLQKRYTFMDFDGVLRLWIHYRSDQAQ